MALRNAIVSIMVMNSVAVYCAARVAVCSNILVGRNRRMELDKKCVSVLKILLFR
jgi:hypothetical protein